MSAEKQQEALEKYKATGELSYTQIKDMKSDGQQEKEAAGKRENMSQSDIGMNTPEELETEGENWERTASAGYEEHPAAGDEYQTPHPEGITSLCYSCTEYEKCNVKTGTCTKCDQYKNRAEAHKTEEQRYSEEQDRIDRETAKKLREREDEERMKNVPSEAAGQQDSEKKYLRASRTMFERITKGEQNFVITKKDGFKVGEKITIGEFTEGRTTGNTLEVMISYMEDDTTTSAIETGYCIMATCLLNENGEPLERADIKQICADIRANGDGCIEGGDEYIMIDKAVGIIEGGREV